MILCDNFTEHQNFNRDLDATQPGQTYNKPTSIPATDQQKSQYQSQNTQTKNNKPTYNKNRGCFKPKVNFADVNKDMDEKYPASLDDNICEKEANSAFMFSKQRICTKCFDKDHFNKDHDSIIKLRKEIYEKSNP